MEIYRQDNPPDSATSGDRWVDTYDLKKIWLIHTDYDHEATQATLTIDAVDRPGSVDLVFTATATGAEGENISVVLADQGASGTSALVKTGSGTRQDPYVYTFNTYQDDNSNDSIISLLSGDPDLSATGADATSADVPDINEQLLTGIMDNLTAHQIVIRYKAPPPELINLQSVIDESIPANVRKLIPDGLAARMAMMNEGGGMLSRVPMWESKMRNAILKARENGVDTTFPGSIRL